MQAPRFFARSFVGCFVAFLVFASAVSAQTRSGSDPQADTKPRQAVTFYVLGGTAPEALYFMRGPGERRFDIPMLDSTIAGPFEREMSDEVLIERLVHPTKEELATVEARRKAGERVADPQPRVVAGPRVKLPAGCVNVFVLLVCSGESIRSALPFDQTESAVPTATVLVHNLSALETALRLGTQAASLAPKSSHRLSVATPNGKSAMMEVQLAVRKNDEWLKQPEGMSVINPRYRRLALVVPGGAIGAQVLLLPPAAPDPVQPAGVRGG